LEKGSRLKISSQEERKKKKHESGENEKKAAGTSALGTLKEKRWGGGRQANHEADLGKREGELEGLGLKKTQ